jgi:hypothetical protein
MVAQLHLVFRPFRGATAGGSAFVEGRTAFISASVARADARALPLIVVVIYRPRDAAPLIDDKFAGVSSAIAPDRG